MRVGKACGKMKNPEVPNVLNTLTNRGFITFGGDEKIHNRANVVQRDKSQLSGIPFYRRFEEIFV